MWSLALKNVLRRRGQSALSIVITTLTILTLVLVCSVFMVIQDGLKLSSSRLGADIMVLPDKANANAYETLFTANPVNIYMNKDVLNKISKVDGIEKLSPQFFTQTLEGGCCSYGEAIRLVGYDGETDFLLKPWFNEQEFNKLKDDEAIIGSKVETQLGNHVAILGKWFKVVGTLYPTGSGMDETIYLNIGVTQKLATEIDDIKGLFKETPPENLISTIFIKTKQGEDPKKIAENINKLGINVQAISTNETIGNIKEQMKVIKTISFALLCSLILVSSLALVGRFNSLAKERKKEIGFLRALGLQRKEIFRLILTEAWIIAGIGGIIGSIIGTLLTNPLINELKSVWILPSGVWSLTSALKYGALGVLAALLLGFLACIYPALKSANQEPQEAITQGEIN